MTIQDENTFFSDYLNYGQNAALISCLSNFGSMYEWSPEPWGVFTAKSDTPNILRYSFTTTPIIGFTYTVPYLKKNYPSSNSSSTSSSDDVYYSKYIKDQWSSVYWGFNVQKVHVMSSTNSEESNNINECINYSNYLANPKVSTAILNSLFEKINIVINSVPYTDDVDVVRNDVIDNITAGFPPDCSLSNNSISIKYETRDLNIDNVNSAFDDFIYAFTTLESVLEITDISSFISVWDTYWEAFYSSFQNLQNLYSSILTSAEKVFASNKTLMDNLLNQGNTTLYNQVVKVNIIGTEIYDIESIMNDFLNPINIAINQSGVLNDNFVPKDQLSIESEESINGLFMSFVNHMKDNDDWSWVPEDYQARKPSYTISCDPDTKESIYTITYPYDSSHVVYGESSWGFRQDYTCVFPFNPNKNITLKPIPINASSTDSGVIELENIEKNIHDLEKQLQQAISDGDQGQAEFFNIQKEEQIKAYNDLYNITFSPTLESSSSSTSSEEQNCYRLRVMNGCPPFDITRNKSCLTGKFVIQMIKRRYPTFYQKETSSSSSNIEQGYHPSQSSEDVIIGGLDRITNFNCDYPYATLKTWYDMDFDIPCPIDTTKITDRFPYKNDLVYFSLKNQPLSSVEDIIKTKEFFRINNDYNPFIGLPKEKSCKTKDGIDFFAESNCSVCCDQQYPDHLQANVNLCPQCFECTLEDGSKSYRYVEFLDNGIHTLTKADAWPEDDACTYEVTDLNIVCTCVTKPTDDSGEACSTTVSPKEINNAILRVYFLNGRVEAALIAQSVDGSETEYTWFYGIQKLIGQQCRRKYRIPSITSLPEKTRLMPLTGEITIAPDDETPMEVNVCGSCDQDEWALTLLMYIELDIGLKLMLFKDTQWYDSSLPEINLDDDNYKKGVPYPKKIIFTNQFNSDDFLGKELRFDDKELEYLLDTFWSYKFLTSLNHDKIIIGKGGIVEAYPCLVPPNGLSPVDYDALLYTDWINNGSIKNSNYPYKNVPNKDYCGFFDYGGPAYALVNDIDYYKFNQKNKIWVNLSDTAYRGIDSNSRPNTLFSPPSVSHNSFTVHICDEEIFVNEPVKIEEVQEGICRIKGYFPIYVYSISDVPIDGLTKEDFMFASPPAGYDPDSLYECLVYDPNLMNWSGDNISPPTSEEGEEEAQSYLIRNRNTNTLSPYIYDTISFGYSGYSSNSYIVDKYLPEGNERQCKSISPFVSKNNLLTDWYKLKNPIPKGTTLYISGIFAQKRYLRQIVQFHNMISADRPELYKNYNWGLEDEDIVINSMPLNDKYNAITSSKIVDNTTAYYDWNTNKEEDGYSGFYGEYSGYSGFTDTPTSIVHTVNFVPACMTSNDLEIDMDVYRMSEISSNATILHKMFLKKYLGQENFLLSNVGEDQSSSTASTPFAWAMDDNGIILLYITFSGDFEQETIVEASQLNQEWFESYLQANVLKGKGDLSLLLTVKNDTVILTNDLNAKREYTNKITSGMLFDVSKDINNVVRDHYKIPYLRSFALAIKKLSEDGGKITKDYNINIFTEDFSTNVRRLDINQTKYDDTSKIVDPGLFNPFYDDDLTNALFIPSGSTALYNISNNTELYNFKDYGIYTNGYFKLLGIGPFSPAFVGVDYNDTSVGTNLKPSFYALKYTGEDPFPEELTPENSVPFDWSDYFLYDYFYKNPDFINMFGDIGQDFQEYTESFDKFLVKNGFIDLINGFAGTPQTSSTSIDTSDLSTEYYFYSEKSNKKFTSLPAGYYNITYTDGGLEWTGRKNIISVHDPILSFGNGVFFYNTSVPPTIHSIKENIAYSGYEGYSGYTFDSQGGFSGYSGNSRYSPIGRLTPGDLYDNIQNQYIRNVYSSVSDLSDAISPYPCKSMVHLGGNIFVRIQSNNLKPVTSGDSQLTYQLQPQYNDQSPYLFGSFLDQCIFNRFIGLKSTIVTPYFYVPDINKNTRIYIESMGTDSKGTRDYFNDNTGYSGYSRIFTKYYDNEGIINDCSGYSGYSGYIEDKNRLLRCGNIFPNHPIEYMAGELDNFSNVSVPGNLSSNTKEFKDLAILTTPEYCHNVVSYHIFDDSVYSSFKQYGINNDQAEDRIKSLISNTTDYEDFKTTNENIPNKFKFEMPKASYASNSVINAITCSNFYTTLCDYYLLPSTLSTSSSSSDSFCIRTDQIVENDTFYYKRGKLICGIKGALNVEKEDDTVFEDIDVMFSNINNDHYEYFDNTCDDKGFRLYLYVDLSIEGGPSTTKIGVDMMSIGSANKVNDIDNLKIYPHNEFARLDLGLSEIGMLGLFYSSSNSSGEGDLSNITPLATAQAISYSNFDKYKAQGAYSSVVCDKFGYIYVFYEDPINNISSSSSSEETSLTNISVAISTDNCYTWYQHRDIIRLLKDESASRPYAVMDLKKNTIHLFYIYNNNFLCAKNIDVTMFNNNQQNTYQRMEKYLDVFGEDTANNAGLEYYDTFGQALRESTNVIVEGDFNFTPTGKATSSNISCNSPDNQTSLANGETVLSRLKEEIEITNPKRLETYFSETGNKDSKISKVIRVKDGGATGTIIGNNNLGWAAYKNKEGILRVIFMDKSGLMSIKSSKDNNLTWSYSAKDFYINKPTDNLFKNNSSLSSDDTIDQNRVNNLSSQLKDYYYKYSYICNTDMTIDKNWEDTYLSECGISYNGYAWSNDFIQGYSGYSGDTGYTTDPSRCSETSIPIQVVYNPLINKFIVIYFFINKMFVRYFTEDSVNYLEEYYKNTITNNSYQNEELKKLVNNNFALTTNSPNKPLFIVGTAFTKAEEKQYKDLYIIPDNGGKIQDIMINIQPSAYYNKSNYLKIHYMDINLNVNEVTLTPSSLSVYIK